MFVHCWFSQSLRCTSSSCLVSLALVSYLPVLLSTRCNCRRQLFTPSFQGQLKRTSSSVAIYPTPTPLARSLRTYIHALSAISLPKYVPLIFPSHHHAWGRRRTR